MLKIKNKLLPCILTVLFFAGIMLLWMFLSPDKNKTNIKIMEGTAVETNMEIIKSDSPGKTIFIIGGIHGDETSGWMAADKLKKLRTLRSGTLIILSPANAPGSSSGERDVETYRDLNRSFPGTKDRDLTDRLAASIYQAVKNYSPDLVIDLHEAYREEGNRDFLGNSLIFTDMTGLEELVPELILETQNGGLTGSPFSYYNSAPPGSLNREVSIGLKIPALTIEASQEDPLEERIDSHLALLHRILQFYSME